MVVTFLINSLIIVVFSFLIQVPVFIWLYKTLVKNIYIDCIYTSFWFIISQLFISVLLTISNKFLNPEFLCINYQFCDTNINIFINIFTNIFINILVVFFLTLIMNKLILKLTLWDNFFVVYLILLILIIIIPLLVYLYTVLG